MKYRQYQYNLYKINTQYGNNQYVVATDIPTAGSMFKESYGYEPIGIDIVSEYVMIPDKEE